MNNDISSELSKYVGARTSYTSKKSACAPKGKEEEMQSVHSYETAQEYYNALGRTKVNLDKQGISARVHNSIDIFRKDPEFVQSHMDMCDFLQEKGYCLEDAITGADIILEKLKDETTYRP